MSHIGAMHARPRPKRLLAAIAAFAALAVVAAPTNMSLAGTLNVSAAIAPTEIAVGESAQLTIETVGTRMPTVTLPKVSGLEFHATGQSHRIQTINGATVPTTLMTYRVTAQAAGIFTIPGITPKSQPLVLQVNSSAGSGNSPPAGSSGGIRLTPDGSAFVRLELPKREIYVGESIPVEIEVGMRDGFVTSLNGLPTLSGTEFTLNNLSHQPQKAARFIDGKPFTVLKWRSILGAVKPGVFSLSAQSPLTVRIRTRPRSESLLDDLLGDPFLQNFYGPTVAKDITAASPPAAFTVLALPTQGRPPDFRGAVGAFKISSDLSSPTIAAGDPLTLRMRVTGAGNFDRVDSAMLDHVDQWKTYQPKATFNSSDATGYRGEKVIEQPLIAARPGSQTLPGLEFSFFDPDTHRYETVRSSPLSVTVSPSSAVAAANRPALHGSVAGTVLGNLHGALRPDHAATGAFHASLVPIYLQPRFRAVSATLALALTCGWMGLRRSRGARHLPGAGRARSRAAGPALRQMDAASGTGDAVLFFNSARTALQHTLAARWNVAWDRITAADIETRLGDAGEDVGRLFALADEANYSGHELKAVDFQRWTEIVRQQLIGESSR